MGKIIFTISFFILINNAFAQNLMGERIRKLKGRKAGIFLDKGIFHNGLVKGTSTLSTLRRSYNERTKQERIVFDFSTKQIPKVYGLISRAENKIYVDFFDTELKGNVGAFQDEESQFVESINLYPWNDGSVSVEIKFKEKIFCDLFYLDNPGRLVFDVKGSSL